jgi:hypothetical protein
VSSTRLSLSCLSFCLPASLPSSVVDLEPSYKDSSRGLLSRDIRLIEGVKVTLKTPQRMLSCLESLSGVAQGSFS